MYLKRNGLLVKVVVEIVVLSALIDNLVANQGDDIDGLISHQVQGGWRRRRVQAADSCTQE